MVSRSVMILDTGDRLMLLAAVATPSTVYHGCDDVIRRGANTLNRAQALYEVDLILKHHQ